MVNQKELEGIICPIDGTQLKIRNDGGWEHVCCEYCGTTYYNLSEESLNKRAKEYLTILQDWNEADLQRIEYRDRIIKKGKQKGLI